DYQSEIQALNENEEISAIVMDMEGPGGTVDGTNEFGLTVKNSKKPIVTFGDNMVASANYWVASQSRWIIGNKNNPTEFGSIGTLCVHEYWGKYIEENIGEIKIIRAPQSVDKAKYNPIEALTPELESELKADLKEITKDFITAVKKGRGDRLTASESEWGTGKMFKTDEAMKIGLIDGVGTLMDAINKAAELANSSGTKGSSTKSNKQMSLKTAAKKVATRVSSFWNGKSAAAKAAEEEQPAAAEDSTPMWTEDLVFNTDGSGDGAFCIHADTDGNDREFETKIDSNQGNEPPTDPAVTEDDNWNLIVAEEEAAPEEGAAEEGAEANTTIAKMNVSLKKANASVKTLTAQVATLTASLKTAKEDLAAAKKAGENAAASKATTVVSKEDPHKKENETQKHRTKVDDEVDQYIKVSSKTPKQ
ncbi:MAG: S49 family peptidase, partial [Cyclobacteriaceae bacterium]|nr:S49 family peptidase [Cyclobacteriaceae bacterium]